MGCICSYFSTPKIKLYGECSICLEEMNSNTKITALNCAHIYHEKCVNEWLRKNRVCPICLFKI